MANTIGSLIISVEGLELTSEERELINHPLVGGVILFAPNYASRKQLSALTDSIRTARKSPLIIMVDQEGGRVQRFIDEFTRLPFMATFGNLYNENKAVALQNATDCGWLMATELLSAGIDLSLAPVLDLNKGMSSIIGQRAFHASPATVAVIAQAFINGMREAGMAATGKHFPGHGSVIPDSHIAMPVDTRSMAAIAAEDMVPFAQLASNGIDALMAAHIIFPEVDSVAVGFSRYWLQTVLRDQLGFKGAIMTDDLNMEGANISAHYADRVSAAREAGCDFTLLCNNRKAVISVLDTLSAADHQVPEARWKPLQGRVSAEQLNYRQLNRWQKTQTMLSGIQLNQGTESVQFNKLES